MADRPPELYQCVLFCLSTATYAPEFTLECIVTCGTLWPPQPQSTQGHTGVPSDDDDDDD